MVKAKSEQQDHCAIDPVFSNEPVISKQELDTTEPRSTTQDDHPRAQLQRAVAPLRLVPAIGGILAFLAVLFVVWHLDRTALTSYLIETRADVERELAAIRGVAETTINRRIHLVRGVKAHVSINPDMTEQEFADLSANIMREADGIRSVTSIKDNVIDNVYPRAGNENAIGLHLLKHPAQRAAAEHAIKTGQPWLAGPIKLVQGGEAFIHRAPVFETQPGGSPGAGRYWGMVSLVIDKETIVSKIRASVPGHIQIAIRSRDESGETGAMFVGAESIIDTSPIESTISLPTGGWQLYGVPENGWPSSDPGATGRRMIGWWSALMAGTLIYLLLRVTARYRESSRRLEIANERALVAQQAAEQASHREKLKSRVLLRYAADLKAAQNATLNAMKDVESARKELQASNEIIKSSNLELEQFAYVASHDLQEPLRKVSSFCQLLEKDYGDKIDGDGKRYLAYIVDGATRMKQLIEDLLSFSRIQSEEVVPEEIDAGIALENALYNLQGAIEDSGAAVTHDQLPIVLADQQQLTQLLQNLIGNGLKYRSEVTPRIHVGVEHHGHEWIFAVKDNGIGIDPKYHERVFGIFKRLHGRSNYSGTGIGLAICKRIVDRLKGTIRVESEAGQGSTFLFNIPKVFSPAIAGTENNSRSPNVAIGNA